MTDDDESPHKKPDMPFAAHPQLFYCFAFSSSSVIIYQSIFVISRFNIMFQVINAIIQK